MSAETTRHIDALPSELEKILFICASCTTEMEAPIAKVGIKINCHACGQECIVPLPVVGISRLHSSSKPRAAAIAPAPPSKPEPTVFHGASETARPQAAPRRESLHQDEVGANSALKVALSVIIAALVGWAAFTTVRTSRLSDIQVEDQIVTSFDLIAKRRDIAALKTTKVVRDLMPALVDIKKGGSQDGRDIVSAAILKTAAEAHETKMEMAHLLADCASLCLQYPQIATAVIDRTIATERARGNLAYSELMRSFRLWLSQLPESNEQFHIFFLEQLEKDESISPPEPEI